LHRQFDQSEVLSELTRSPTTVNELNWHFRKTNCVRYGKCWKGMLK